MPAVIDGKCGSAGFIYNRKLYGGPAWIRAKQPNGKYWDGYGARYCDCCDPPYRLDADGKARQMVDVTVEELEARIAKLENPPDIETLILSCTARRADELRRLLPEEDDAGVPATPNAD